MTRRLADMLAEADHAVPRIGPAEAAAMQAEGALILDVREAPELEAGMIAGALHVPRGMLEFCADPESEFHLPELRPERPVVVYCGIGERSALAGRRLLDMGYRRVVNLVSFDAWLLDGRPVAPPRAAGDCAPLPRLRSCRYPRAERIPGNAVMTHAHSLLPKAAANHVPLSPLSFLRKAASVFPDHPAIVYGQATRSWAETYARCRRLASALRRAGVEPGDTVAAIAWNTPELYEAHFGVPMAGGVLSSINTRLDARTIAFILDHAEAKLLLMDTEFAPAVAEALDLCRARPTVIDIIDPANSAGGPLGGTDYEQFLDMGDPDFAWVLPADEWDAIAINYTSGTTGDPKGVVCHHRGAYLNAVGNTLEWAMPNHPRYLWTLPMFHCNGWCFPWTVAAKAGTNICLRKVTPKAIYDAIADHGADHLCGAPIVLGMMINAKRYERRNFSHACKVMTAAAPPPASVLQAMQQHGFDVTHVYGLTEVYGPAVACAWHGEWSDLPIAEQARRKARQGVAYLVQEDAIVADPETLAPVPPDGETMGEVLMRGNVTMKGYLKDSEATERAFAGGWFHTGDLGVMHPDGYLQLRDRAKDIIISGGENISSIEVEGVLMAHAAVALAAVVARADEKWGETPCAFVELKPGAEASEAELIAHCRSSLAGFKVPRKVVFTELPKTSTGKVQKAPLRAMAASLDAGEAGR